MNNLLTLDQKRAQFAWQKVEEAAKVDIEKYRNLAKAVPSLIMNSGLMQTLAFLQSKGERHHEILTIHLCKWLGGTLRGSFVSENDRFPLEQDANFKSVMNALYQSQTDLYLRATSEAMALLRWIRQFADAVKAMENRK